ncbi:FkbM family methyltransferase [Candidatus Albibeggiatoa sp. nov. BB20]|uniref:FkbM family methyltransferase n=1 Tax=Candidatus Albibeggiatoa sp. nov. BB20 TaxID=3162723 RepID=UPI003365673A
MSQLRKTLLTAINRVGRIIPKKLQRRLADSPIVLHAFEKLSNNQLEEIQTPEGYSLIINPLFHSNLIHSGHLKDHEPDTRSIISQSTKQNMIAYDIGANVGVFSFLFASIVGDDGKVYAFEPEENNYICLEKSLKKYSKNNIILDKRAVGDSKGVAQFDRRGGAFSGRLIDSEQYNPTANIKQVEVVNIDYLIEQENYPVPDILKIDVEGNEAIVLEGMRNTLEQHSPIIICELHTHLGETVERVISLLTNRGYQVSDVELKSDQTQPQQETKSGDRHIIAIKQC